MGARCGSAWIAAAICRTCRSKKCARELPNVAHLLGDDVFCYLTLEGSVASRNHAGGGMAPDQVRAAAQAAREALNRGERRCP